MPTDPRTTIRNFFEPSSTTYAVTASNLTVENGDLAKHEASFELSESRLKILFVTAPFNLDVIFVVGYLPGREAINTPSGPIGYVHHLYVQPVCIDKFNSDRTLKVSATKLIDLANQEVRRIIRENMSGSMRLTDRETAHIERLGSTLVWGDLVSVNYTQYVTSYADTTSLVANRRFFNHIHEIRVGVSSGDYSKVGESSGLGPIWWQPVDEPVMRLPIPGAYFAVKQLIGNYDLEIYVQVRDYEAVTQLLRTIDVVAGGATETAVEWGSTPTRNAIGYLVFAVYNTKIVNATDMRTPETSSFSFTGNIYVSTVKPLFEDNPAGVWLIKLYADYCTQVDA